jgi:hypothetical protein
MVSIAVVFVIAVAVLGIITTRSNVQKAFALVSIFSIVLFVVSLLGLLHNGNSMVLFNRFRFEPIVEASGDHLWHRAYCVSHGKQGTCPQAGAPMSLSELPNPVRGSETVVLNHCHVQIRTRMCKIRPCGDDLLASNKKSRQAGGIRLAA